MDNTTIGNNKIVIRVITEDDITIKQYILNVERKPILSDNINITVLVNGKEVSFSPEHCGHIYFPYKVGQIQIDYQLEDDKSTIDLLYDKSL